MDQTANIDSECMVLGGLMLENGSLERVIDILKPADFFDASNRLLYSTILQQSSLGKPFDVVTLADTLQLAGRLEDVGGVAYIGQLAQNVYSAAAIEGHAAIVHSYAVRRALIASASQITQIASSENEVAEALDQAQALLSRIADQDLCGSGPVPIQEALALALDDIERRSVSGNALSGRSTGFHALDAMTGGFEPGTLNIVAGRPSMGKSALAMTIALAMANQQDKPSVLIWSGEMGVRQITNRQLAAIGSVPLSELKTGQLRTDKGHWERLTQAVAALNPLCIETDDTPGIGINALRLRARRLNRKRPLGLIVVDYLQLMVGHGENRTQEVSTISRGLKNLSKELSTPVLALSQLNRSVETRIDKRPTMADLRESGQIEQDADLIMMLYRDEIYEPDSMDSGLAELLIRKNRDGEIGKVNLAFKGEFSRFEPFNGPLPSETMPKRQRQDGVAGPRRHFDG